MAVRMAKGMARVVGGLGLSVLSALGLSSCAKDDEMSVRGELERVLYAGDTLWFESKLGCTAAVFETHIDEVKVAMPRVVDVSEALSYIERAKPFAFDNKMMSPNTFSEALMSRQLHMGSGLLSASVGAIDCMSEEVQHAFYEALMERSTLIVFDFAQNSVALLDRKRKLIFFTRGDL